MDVDAWIDATVPYGRHSLRPEDIEVVVEVLKGDWLTTGPWVERFEAALADAVGVPHAVAVNSGSAALHTAYFAAGLGPGDHLITSPLTFVATATMALHLGARVRFADVDPATGTLDPDATEAALDASTRLIVPVDYAGHPCDYARLSELARRRGVALVADACHSLGARLDGRPVATWPDASAVSFHPVKPITTAEGGAVLTRNAGWLERARRFRNHGIEREAGAIAREGPWYYEVRDLGFNYRLPDVLCALGWSQLRRLKAFLAARQGIAARYREALKDIAGLELPEVAPGAEPGWHLYVVRVRDPARRRPFFERLRAQGIGVQVHYIPVPEHPVYRELGYRTGLCPRAEAFSARAVSLPIFPGLRPDALERIVEAVRGAALEIL